MIGSKHNAPSPIRLPQELKDWIKRKAIDNRRSFNSEVLVRLEQSREQQEKAQPQGAQA